MGSELLAAEETVLDVHAGVAGGQRRELPAQLGGLGGTAHEQRYPRSTRGLDRELHALVGADLPDAQGVRCRIPRGRGPGHLRAQARGHREVHGAHRARGVAAHYLRLLGAVRDHAVRAAGAGPVEPQQHALAHGGRVEVEVRLRVVHEHRGVLVPVGAQHGGQRVLGGVQGQHGSVSGTGRDGAHRAVLTHQVPDLQARAQSTARGGTRNARAARRNTLNDPHGVLRTPPEVLAGPGTGDEPHGGHGGRLREGQCEVRGVLQLPAVLGGTHHHDVAGTGTHAGISAHGPRARPREPGGWSARPARADRAAAPAAVPPRAPRGLRAPC